MSKELLVVKYGSSCVAGPDGIDQGRIDEYAGRLAEVSEAYRVVVVSSGSIAVGTAMWEQGEAEAMDFLGDDYGTAEFPNDQVLASLGSAPAVTAWQQALRRCRADDGRLIRAGQIQVTHHEIRDKKEGLMLLDTMQDCLDSNVVSIVNENDALSDVEIKKLRYGGDNDGLARHVAAIMGANRLCLLTAEEEGLIDEKGNVIDIVKPRDVPRAMKLAGEAGKRGKGGMRSKVQATVAAAASGIRAHIANPQWPIMEILDRQHGTYFPPH